MQEPYDLEISNPNIELETGGKSFQIEPLKSRESRQMKLNLILTEDANHNYKQEMDRK